MIVCCITLTFIKIVARSENGLFYFTALFIQINWFYSIFPAYFQMVSAESSWKYSANWSILNFWDFPVHSLSLSSKSQFLKFVNHSKQVLELLSQTLMIHCLVPSIDEIPLYFSPHQIWNVSTVIDAIDFWTHLILIMGFLQNYLKSMHAQEIKKTA